MADQHLSVVKNNPSKDQWMGERLSTICIKSCLHPDYRGSCTGFLEPHVFNGNNPLPLVVKPLNFISKPRRYGYT